VRRTDSFKRYEAALGALGFISGAFFGIAVTVLASWVVAVVATIVFTTSLNVLSLVRWSRGRR
jgi:hypothetical protein